LLLACGEGKLTAFTSEAALGGAPAGAGPDGGIDTEGSSVPQVFTTLLIDDFEDGDTRVTPESESWWYIFNDSTGQQEFLIDDVSEQRPNSVYAAHTFGEAFTAWGAGLGVDLAGIQDARNPSVPFDASQFAGISFWARVAENSVKKTRVDLLSPCGDDCASY